MIKNNLTLAPALAILAILIFTGCGESRKQETSETIIETEQNPHAAGFNVDGSDPDAVQIADNVMDAMGGRENWDNTRCICWEFFGRRHLIWDKWTGDVRIDSYGDSAQYILNINTMEGRAAMKGTEISEADSLVKLLDRGKRIWINDSYWLVMPFKLKDSGVTLKYLREDTTLAGLQSDVLQLTFDNVGVTPNNRYEVWVEKESSLVRQWAFYRFDTLQEPGFINPWDDWTLYGNIYLSGNRGDRALSEIIVMVECPENTFSSFDPVNLD